MVSSDKIKARGLPFFFDTWESHTNHLSDSAYRAYHRLIGFMWEHGEKQSEISQNNSILARATKLRGSKLKRVMEEIMPDQSPLLQVEDNKLVSKRLRQEHEKFLKRSDRGKVAASARHKQCLDIPGGDSKQPVSNAAEAEADCPSPSHSYKPNREPKDNIGELTSKSILSRIQRATNDDEHWQRWWAAVVMAFEQRGALPAFDALLRYVEDCGDPLTRRAKDIGKLKRPGAYLCKKTLQAAREFDITIPRHPGKTQGAAT